MQVKRGKTTRREDRIQEASEDDPMNGRGWFRRFATLWLVLLAMGHPAQAWGWSKSFDGDNVGNSAEKVVALAGGDVVAYANVGVRYYPGGYDVIDKLIRFSGASGEEVWRSANSLGQESLGALMATPGGDLYSSSHRGGVIRHSEADGVRLWGNSVAGTCSGYNTFTWFGGLAAHPSGDVVLGATGCVSSSNVAKFTVGRLNASDGSLAWHTQVESQPPSDRQPSGSSLAVAADAAGDVVAVGELALTGPPQGRQFAVVKFDGGSGQELWRYPLSGTEDSRANAVAIDSQDNIAVAGTVSGVLTVCKFSPTGVPLWNASPITSEPIGCRQQFFFNNPSRVFRGAVLLAAVDGDGNVIVGGHADVCTGRSLLLMKLAEFDGSPVWSLNPGQPTCPPFATWLTTPGSATQMVVDSAGDIAIVGQGASHWVAKVAGDTGVQLWSKPFPPLGTMKDVALDGMGNALVAGTDTSRYSCRNADALVAKLRGSDGAVAPSCGDNVEDVDEECDDGNTDDNDGCSADCTVEHGCCGDGVTFGVGEECDGADAAACPGNCQANCVCGPPPLCGDGQQEGQEECDDGNSEDCLDLCHNDCTDALVNVCGDGYKCGTEECDDRNTVPGDGCSQGCRSGTNVCGDGIVQGSEECDSGHLGEHDGCSASCKIVCGDGKIYANETCDDGNTQSRDGCSRLCQLESAPPHGHGRLSFRCRIDSHERYYVREYYVKARAMVYRIDIRITGGNGGTRSGVKSTWVTNADDIFGTCPIGPLAECGEHQDRQLDVQTNGKWHTFWLTPRKGDFSHGEVGIHDIAADDLHIGGKAIYWNHFLADFFDDSCIASDQRFSRRVRESGNASGWEGMPQNLPFMVSDER